MLHRSAARHRFLSRVREQFALSTSRTGRQSRRRNQTATTQAFVQAVEVLEDRTLLTNYLVNTATDDADDVAGTSDGLISLREAINAAVSNAAFGDAPAGSPGGDTISFAASLANATIVIATGEELVIGDGDLGIDGGSLGITIDGNNITRLLRITKTDGSAANIVGGLTFTNGFGNLLIEGNGTATLNDLTVSNTQLSGYGGGILIKGSSHVTASSLTVTGNKVNGDGGGIAVLDNGTLDLSDSTISDNQTTGAIGEYHHDGGGLYVGVGAVVNLTHTDVTGNLTELVGVGGQIANYGTLTIDDSMIQGHQEVVGNDVDFFESTGAKAGDLVFAHVSTRDSRYRFDDSTLTVRAEDGTLIEYNNNFASSPDSAVAGAIVPSDGNVTYEVTGNYDTALTSYQFYSSIVDPALAISETESNDTAATADAITTETLITGHLSTSSDIDFYSFTVPAGGAQVLAILDRDPDDNGQIAEARLAIIDADGHSALSEDDGAISVVGGPTAVTTGGTYYIRIRDHGHGTDTNYQFVLKLIQPTDRVNEIEPNDSAAAAQPLEFHQFAQGTIPQTTTSTSLDAYNGGGIYNAGGAILTVNDSVISQNLGLKGGGVYNAGRADLVNTFVVSNEADHGGGLFNQRGGVLILRDRTIVSGNTATGDDVLDGGGGIYNSGGGSSAASPARLAIAGGVIISGNAAAGSGGGIYSNSGVVTIEDSTISGNSAVRSGGGIEMVTGTVELHDSHLDGNAAIGDGMEEPGNGGGLHVRGATGYVGYVRVFGGTINNNTAAGQGGGLWNQAGNIMVVRQGAIVDGNSASGDAASDGGGGIFNNAGRLSIGEAAQITNNRADGTLGSGGGIFTTGSGVSLDSGTVVSGNTAVRSGGGIEMVLGLTTIIDSTISDNHALGGGDGAPGNGGGIHVSGTSGYPRVDVRNSTIADNTAATQGGGLWMAANSVALVRIGSSVTGNTASGDDAGDGGGGIYNQGGRLLINAANINVNHADGAKGSGGGILTLANTTTVENGTVNDNTAVRAGGGVEIVNGLFESRHMTLQGNAAVGGGAAAPGNGGGLHVTGTSHVRVNLFETNVLVNSAASQGGGLWNQNGSIMLVAQGSQVQTNSAGNGAATDGGGGIFNNGGRLAVEQSLLTGNAATGRGGGILSVGGGLSVDNSTLAFNNATDDGGGIVSNGDLIANNSTIAQNLADSDDAGGGTGGGLFNGGTATLHNTILAGNVFGTAFIASDVAGNNLGGGSRNTLISDAGSSGGLVDGAGGNIVGVNGAGTRPLFDIVTPLADNGGLTETYALADGSVAINAGDNAFAKNASGVVLTNDQRGFGYRRIEAGTVDIGAFEVQS